MQIPQTLNKRRRISLTPLIDVIFLLLLFFMLSSTFSKFSEVKINTGSNGAGSASENLVFLVITSEGLNFDRETITREALPEKLSEAKDAGKETVVLVVSKDVTSQEFLTFLSVVNAGPLPVSVARRSQ